jgi:hypothetical protein
MATAGTPPVGHTVACGILRGQAPFNGGGADFRAIFAERRGFDLLAASSAGFRWRLDAP